MKRVPNPAIPTGIFPQSRNSDGFYRLIPIPVIIFKVLPTEQYDPWSSAPDPLTVDPADSSTDYYN